MYYNQNLKHVNYIDVNGKSHTCLSHINVPGLLPYRGLQSITNPEIHPLLRSTSGAIQGKLTVFSGCSLSRNSLHPTVCFSKLGVLNDFTMCFLLFIVSA